MLRLTRRSEYGIIAMTFLAQRRAIAQTEDEAAVSARDIAERYHIPKRLLAEVMKDLVHKGLVRSARGASGGYRISAPAERTTILHLLQALEGPFEMVPCASDASDGIPEHLCELLSFCPIKGPIHRIHEKINQFLGTVTLADLARGELNEHFPAASATSAPLHP